MCTTLKCLQVDAGVRARAKHVLHVTRALSFVGGRNTLRERQKDERSRALNDVSFVMKISRCRVKRCDTGDKPSRSHAERKTRHHKRAFRNKTVEFY
ncbi:hypothetical protein X777_15833 [Ooceraea biroi]|uniref:Uncharacterized protein n=1 Tax=Ooceraea biroi TaxID=2015173 RepID=A0A026WU71_OOCBI|nr:hypothetical protein X777_15833 [Ooceraea biroi]